MERLKLESEERCTNQSNDIDGGLRSSEQGGTSRREGNATNFLGGPSSWYGVALSNISIIIVFYIIKNHI